MVVPFGTSGMCRRRSPQDLVPEPTSLTWQCGQKTTKGVKKRKSEELKSTVYAFVLQQCFPAFRTKLERQGSS